MKMVTMVRVTVGNPPIVKINAFDPSENPRK